MVRFLLKNVAPHVLLCFFFTVIAGCSQNDGGTQGEGGSADKLTDRAAETAVTKIRTPLDKAREAAGQGEERAEEMERAVRQQ